MFQRHFKKLLRQIVGEAKIQIRLLENIWPHYVTWA